MRKANLRAVVDIDAADIDRFVEDPSKLVELCREVIQHLDASSDDGAVAEQEAQLRAIAKAVEQLEKSRVAWQNNACCERLKMRQHGILKDDSPTGIWELVKEH